jgi:TRAP-type C4-dicarboxylate transport system permease small subunit
MERLRATARARGEPSWYGSCISEPGRRRRQAGEGKHKMRLEGLARAADRVSGQVNWAVERVCALLAVILILDVWLGVFVRYVWPLPITFMEEAARYLMIWMALLAISAGIVRREHIGVMLLYDALAPAGQRALLLLLDLLGFAFFLFLLVYGIGLVESGANRLTMIYGLSKSLPFAAVPVAAALAAFQIVCVALRDQWRLHPAAAAPGTLA